MIVEHISPYSALFVAVRGYLQASLNSQLIRAADIRLTARPDSLPPECLLPAITIFDGGATVEEGACRNEEVMQTVSLGCWCSDLIDNGAGLVGGPGNPGVANLVWFVHQALKHPLAPPHEMMTEAWKCTEGWMSNSLPATAAGIGGGNKELVYKQINYNYRIVVYAASSK